MYKKLCLCFLLVAGYSAAFAQANPGARKLQKMVESVVKKVMPATVKIAAFDTVSQTLAVSRFSGVIVSADGLILTAAHATQPKKVYQICFPNGSKVLAKGLGRISLGKDKPATDVAMLQIIEKGKWPFAEMGYSAEMRTGQPCVGISFPGTFEQPLPNIRLGRLENVNIEKGNFQSSCKMEPGDSGGPLFDSKGRLIGIHSWILPDEQQNFEVPIDLYRKYWDALHIPISYDHLPEATAFAEKPKIVSDSIPPLDLLADLKPETKASVVYVRSVMYGRLQFALATIVTFGTGNQIQKAIVTKNSSTGDQVLVTINGKQTDATVIARDVENDLALLRTEQAITSSIDISAYQKTVAPPVGTLLFSPMPDGKSKTGVASTGIIEMLLKYSSGYFGASANFIDQKVTITEIPKGCPADGIFQLNDQIISINGVAMDRPERYGAELAKYYPNDTVAIDAVRGGQSIKLKVKLGVYRPNMHTADGFPGGKSIRSDGFKTVIAQDAALKPGECGGPVFNADGDFIGINIGRHSRTSTIIMPAGVVNEFCEKYLTTVVNYKAK